MAARRRGKRGHYKTRGKGHKRRSGKAKARRRAAAKLKRKVRKIISGFAEQKYFDKAVGTVLSTTMSYFNLCEPPEGLEGNGGRVGDKIRIRRVIIKGSVTAADTSFNPVGNLFDLYLIWQEGPDFVDVNTDPSAQFAAGPDIFTQLPVIPGSWDDAGIHVLKHWKINLQVPNTGDYGTPYIGKPKHFYADTGYRTFRETEFLPGTTNFRKGCLQLWGRSDSTAVLHPQIQFYSRVFYTDT